jgi:Transposase
MQWRKRIWCTLLTVAPHLTDQQRARLDKRPPLGDPNSEVESTWHIDQQVRSIYTATNPAADRKTARKVLKSLHTCPIPQVTKLDRTLRQWPTEIPAYFDTGGVYNDGTEAINGVIEKTHRLTHGLPQLHQLQDPNPARHRRHPPLPASTDQDSISQTNRPKLIYEEPVNAWCPRRDLRINHTPPA